MNALLGAGYRVAATLARAAAAIAPPGQGKLRRTFHARSGIRQRYAAWGAHSRDVSRPLLWIHAPSVGEGLQARPVLEALRASRPDAQLAYTFFSPSAEPFARGLDVDFRDYLPFDTAGDVRAALDALRPHALVFSKLDVWPALTTEAARRSVRLGLISATLAPGSARARPLARALLRDAYARLDLVGAIDEADAARLVALGTCERAIRITGDTRYDQVWARASAVRRESALLAPLASARPTLVAGSTWPADERPLLAAWERVRAAHPTARLILAPHEPTHLAPIARWARRAGLALERLDARAAGEADVVLVDRVGVLAELYALADIAYVGGGFHAAGLHSVLEPAAFGAPVVVGPRHAASRDAALLLAAGGAVAAGGAASLAAALARWMSNPSERHHAGAAARGVVQGGLGAAARSTALVRELLEGAAHRA